MTAMGVADVDGDDAGYYDLTALDADGDTVLARRYTFEPERIPAHVADSAHDARIRDARLPEFAKLLRGADLPDVYSPLHSMMIGTDHGFWLRVRSSSDHYAWLVLDARGEPLDAVRMPRSHWVLSASLDEIWVCETDDLGVPSVVRYRIER